METGLDYIIIDGYNVINAWRDMIDIENHSLEDCRERLLGIISNYQGYSSIKLIVVFDAHLRSERQTKTEKYDNLTVVFTKKNQTADIYIERLVYKLSKEHTVGVVTSDYLEQKTVLNSGGIRITPRELKMRILDAGRRVSKIKKGNNEKSNTIFSNVDARLLRILDEMRKS